MSTNMDRNRKLTIIKNELILFWHADHSYALCVVEYNLPICEFMLLKNCCRKSTLPKREISINGSMGHFWGKNINDCFSKINGNEKSFWPHMKTKKRLRCIELLQDFRSCALQEGYRAGQRQPVSRCLFVLGRLRHCLLPWETNTNCPLAPGWRCAAGDMWLKIALLVPVSGGHKAP